MNYFHTSFNSLSESKSSQFFRTLLSILADFNSTVVWMVSIIPQNSSSSSLFSIVGLIQEL